MTEMPRELKNFIDGRWMTGSGPLVQDVSPADERNVLATFHDSTPTDVNQAVTAAQKAFGEWRRRPAPARGRLLLKLHGLLAERRERFSELMADEQGKTLAEADGEVQKGLNLVEFFAGEGFRLNGETVPSEVPGTFTYTLREPLGVVSAITPWNFPFAIPLWKLCPAVVAGNTVVFKPASTTPLVASLLMETWVEAGLPSGVVNLILGSGGTAGEASVTDPRVRALSFTGSNQTGQRLAGLVAGRPVKVTMEMGGKNAVVVARSADLDLAALGVVNGAFGAAGQRCTATSRVLVDDAVLPEFLARCQEQMARSVRIGLPRAPSVSLGPLITARQRDKVLSYVEDAAAHGATVVTGGQPPQDGALSYGNYVEPTLVTGVTPEMALFQEEIFGPVLGVTPFSGLEEAIALVNQVRYGLTAAIYTRELSEAHQFIAETEVGMVHVNNPTIGGEAQLPFGGVKESGSGPREMGHEGTLFFTETKTVFLDFSGRPRDGKFY